MNNECAKALTMVAALLVSFNAQSAESFTGTALRIVDTYKTECTSATNIAGNDIPQDETPIFDLGEGGFYTLNLGADTPQAEVISTARMTCNDYSMGYCGSSGCTSHIVIDDRAYDAQGSRPKMLQGGSQNYIVWNVSGYLCETPEKPVVSSSSPCTIAAIWDSNRQRLSYPHLQYELDSRFN